MTNLTPEDLEKIQRELSYKPETGELVWVNPKGHRSIGLAGTQDPRGYRVVNFGVGKRAYYHQIAWFLGTVLWPKGVIDHINRDKSDNRLCNLRDTTAYTNAWNRFRGLYTGVRYRKERLKWQAYVHEGGRFTNLGHFKCRTAALFKRLKYNKDRDG